MIEVEPRPQRELLAGQRAIAAGQDGRQPRLRREHRRATAPAGRRHELSGLGPQAVGDLLARAVPDPHDERLARLTTF